MASCDGQTGEADFDYTFAEDTELTGCLKLYLFASAESYNGMDLFVNVKKLGTDGRELPITLFGQNHPGVWGMLRVSRRYRSFRRASGMAPSSLSFYRRNKKWGTQAFPNPRKTA